MPRHVRDARLESRDARRRLAAQSEPHWRAIVQGAHVGYYKGARRAAWLVRWRKPDGGYRKATLGEADDTRDADGVTVLDYRMAQQRALEQIKAWEHAPEAEPVKPWTVADAIAGYAAWAATHRKPSTVRDIHYAASAHISPELGALELRQLTTTRLRRWLEDLAEQPARLRTRKGATQRRRASSDDPDAKRRRRATVNRVWTILRAALNRAWRDEKVASDAAWRKVAPFEDVDAARVRYLQLDECRRLLNACPSDFRQLVRAALATGCRYSELGNASVRDFSRDAGALLVIESKSGKSRHVPLDDDAIAFLAGMAAGRAPDAPLLPRADGTRWRKSHQARPLLTACEASRIEPAIGFHGLRHTYASLRIMGGMPLLAVASVLGHRDTRMVERHYGHLAPSYIRDAVRRTALDLGPVETGVEQLRPGTA